ncbi:MAG: DNA repair protein RadA [Candidatus Omnitrophica bacterium]|nr:DNA repair protein RadA [Candidatus Omnitrophota bacterium]
MPKTKTIFTCQNCGAQSPKWLGKCPDCNSWSSFVEEDVVPERSMRFEVGTVQEHPVLLNRVEIKKEPRWETGIKELDRVLGGGVVIGSVVLIGGDPGIGKSTLSLQMSSNLSKEHTVLYVSGEESTIQTKMRANRLSSATGDNFYIVNLVSLEGIFEAIKKIGAEIVIIDSIQVIYTPEVTSSPGSVSQVRECAGMLTKFAKQNGVSMFIIGHVTKEGTIAGPRVLEHIVDTVLYFEGDRFSNYRMLRAVKNRFGSTNEVGVFEMSGRGLIEVANPSEYFLSERTNNISGSVIFSTMEGTRPLLVEIQSLVSKAGFGMVRRKTQGIDFNRINLLVAVLEKRIGLKLEDKDVFVNIVGGISISDPAADLAITTAITSSFYDKAIPKDLIILGEVGLGGEIRSVTSLSLRLKESVKLGFKKAIIPQGNTKDAKETVDLKLYPFGSLREVFKFLWKEN